MLSDQYGYDENANVGPIADLHEGIAASASARTTAGLLSHRVS